MDSSPRPFLARATAASFAALAVLACSDGDGLTDLEPPLQPAILVWYDPLGPDPNGLRGPDPAARTFVPATGGSGVLSLSLDIPWTFINPLSETIFFTSVGGGPVPVVERLVDGAWVPEFNDEQLLALVPTGTFAIAPGGETYSDTVHVTVGTMQEILVPASFTGTYRLNWSNYAPPFSPHLFRSAGRGSGELDLDPLPRDFSIVSAPFTLIDPRDEP